MLGGKRPDDGFAAEPHLTAHLALSHPSACGGETVSMSTAAKEVWNTAWSPTMLPCSATADPTPDAARVRAVTGVCRTSCAVQWASDRPRRLTSTASSLHGGAASPLMAAAASSIRCAGSTTTIGRYTLGAAMPIICLCCKGDTHESDPTCCRAPYCVHNICTVVSCAWTQHGCYRSSCALATPDQQFLACRQRTPATARSHLAKSTPRNDMHLTTTALLRAAESQGAQSTCQTAGRRPPGGRVGGQAADVVQVPVADEGDALQGGPVGAPPQVERHLPGGVIR